MDGAAIFFWVGMAGLLAVAVVLRHWHAEELARRFAEARGEWIASIRRSNLDLLSQGFSEQPERPRYLDAFGKLGFEINDRLKITGNILRLEDDISLSDDVDREERAFAKQLDVYAWLKLDHDINGVTSGSTVVARTTIDSRRAGASAKDGVSQGVLSDSRNFTIDTLRTRGRADPMSPDSLMLERDALVELLDGQPSG